MRRAVPRIAAHVLYELDYAAEWESGCPLHSLCCLALSNNGEEKAPVHVMRLGDLALQCALDGA